MKDIKDWVIQWFENNTNGLREHIIKNSHSNYFEEGWLDSLKFIEFIVDIENTFKIQFSNNEFQNRMFSSIDGITKIIESKKNETI